MTDLIVSILYIIGLAAAVVIPMVTTRSTIKFHLLDKEDEILHELTACRED